MKRAYYLLVLLVAVPLAMGQQPGKRPEGKPSEKASIAGMVTRKGSDEPLKKARVALSAVDGRGPMYGAVTDADGRFEIAGIEPGRYRLWVEKNGYARQGYGQRSPARTGTPLALAAGQRLRDLDFHLTPAGVVTGRVVDEDNEPIANARVQALQFRYWDAQRRLVPAGNTGTNDLGEYRLFGLSPGRYYISATYTPEAVGLAVRGSAVHARSSEPGGREGYARTYYPGSNDAAHATLVAVRAGGETQGIDVALLRTRTALVSGLAANGVTGRPARFFTVFLESREESSAVPYQNVVSGFQGKFQISDVPPGSYDLAAVADEDGKRYFTRMPMEVGNADVEGVKVVLMPGFDLAGHLRVESKGQVALSELYVVLNAGDVGRMAGRGTGRVKADGSFVIEGAAPLEYRLRVAGMPEDYYLQSARMGDDDVLKTGLDLSRAAGAPGTLEITVSAGAGKIDGVVMDEKQKPFGGAQVVLAPKTDQPGRTDLRKTTTTDQYGHFGLKGIVPGEYRVFAFEDADPGAYQDPEFLKPYESKAETVRIGKGEEKSLQLALIPVEEDAQPGKK